MAITILSTYPDSAVNSYTSPIRFQVTTDSTDITTEIQAIVFYRRNIDDFWRVACKSLQKKQPLTNYFEFNVASVLEKLLTQDYQTGSTGLKTVIENSAIEFFIKFTEYYPSSLFAAHGTTNSSSYYVSNTSLYHTETQGTGVGTDWYMDAAGTHKFLTDSPSSQLLRASERVQLDFLTSKTDPCVRVKETKLNLSTNTVEYELPDTTFASYLWDWAVDENELITVETPDLYTQSTWIEAVSGGTYVAGTTSGFKYMPDTNKTMWGGVALVLDNDQVDIILPVLGVASASVLINHMASGSNATFEVYYYYSAAWNASASNPISSTLNTFANFIEALPANTTKLRIKKIAATGTQELWVPYAYVGYSSDNVVNKRCQFTLDTTHIDSDTKDLQIWVVDTTGGSTMSEIKTFTVDKTPAEQVTTRFAVRNKKGGFDHFTYTQMHSEVLTAEKTRSTKELPNVFTTKDRGIGVTQVNSEKIFTCYSDFIEEDNLRWWATIIESKEVYVVVSDVLYSVDILTDSVVTYAHTDLVQLQIGWSYSVKR